MRFAAICLVIEALFGLGRIGRIASMLVVYGPAVMAVTTVRGLVTALALVAARLLWRVAPGGPELARAALLSSAALRVLETGLRLAPSSLQPGLEWYVVSAYFAYALVADRLLRIASSRR